MLEAEDDEEKESEVDGEVEERVTQRVHETWWMRHKRESWAKVWCARNQTRTTLKRHYRRTNRKALTSLQLVYSCVFTCFRFTSTLHMLLCLLFCAFVSLIQSSSVFPRIHFSPVCDFLVIPCNCSHCENGSFEVLSLQNLHALQCMILLIKSTFRRQFFERSAALAWQPHCFACLTLFLWFKLL